MNFLCSAIRCQQVDILEQLISPYNVKYVVITNKSSHFEKKLQPEVHTASIYVQYNQKAHRTIYAQ